MQLITVLTRNFTESLHTRAVSSTTADDKWQAGLLIIVLLSIYLLSASIVVTCIAAHFALCRVL